MIPKQTEFTRRIPLLSMKQMDIDAKVAKKMVHAWDALHSPERLREVFFQDAHRLSDPHYWELLRTVWVAAGSTDTADLFRPYFLSRRPCKSWFMTVEDAAALDRMTFPLKVWRAYDREPDPGWVYELVPGELKYNPETRCYETTIEAKPRQKYIIRED